MAEISQYATHSESSYRLCKRNRTIRPASLLGTEDVGKDDVAHDGMEISVTARPTRITIDPMTSASIECAKDSLFATHPLRLPEELREGAFCRVANLYMHIAHLFLGQFIVVIIIDFRFLVGIIIDTRGLIHCRRVEMRRCTGPH